MDRLNCLNVRYPRIQNEEDYFRSAVLLPVIEKDGNLHILFEVRSSNLIRQPGEVCFPGGKIEKEEEDKPELAALREASEELGILERHIEMIGPLDYIITPPGALIYPYAGKILRPEELNPNRAEVEEVFTAPVEYFLKNSFGISYTEVATRYATDFPFHRVSSSYSDTWQKRWSFPVYYCEYGGHFIWGITARILRNFIGLCFSGDAGFG